MARQHAAAAALFAVLAVAMTWPLARALGSAVAWPGDPFINIWILDWDWWATFHRPLALFQASAFYPAKDSLAFSENLYGIALVLFPLRAAGVPPIAAYNVAMLLGYAFSGFGAYLLGRYVTGSWWAGVAAGIFYAFVPFRLTHAAHVQHVWAGWLPVMVLALLRYWERPGWGRAAVFGGVFLANGLCNVHWLLFGAVGIGLIGLIGLIGPIRPIRLLGPIGPMLALALLLLTPFLLPYATVARDYHMLRTWQEVKSFSATASSWVTADPKLRWYGALADDHTDPELWLFPGAVGIALSAIGLFTRDRRVLAIALAWIVLGVAGSFGTHLFFHRFLFAHVPGFRAIRVPARWANIAYVGMSLLIASAAGKRRWAGPLASAALVVELCAAPILWYIAVPQAPPVYRWIRDAKPHAVLELPIGRDNDYSYMLRATVHHRPIVNGISGFAPPEVVRVVRLVNSDALVPELRRIGVSHVVVHGDYVDDATRGWLRRELDAGRIAFVQRFDNGVQGDWVFATGGGAPNVPPALDAFLAGRPTFNGGTFGFLDLPAPGQRIAGKAYFSGYALSPYGVRSVALLFANGAVRVEPFRVEDGALRQRFPWYDATAKPRFLREIAVRPPGVAERTDVQVEIVDGRGKRTLLEDRFFLWP